MGILELIFFFRWYGVWTQGLKHSVTWAMSLALFALFSLFFKQTGLASNSWFFYLCLPSNWGYDHVPPISSFFLFLDGVLLTVLPWLALNHNPPISTSSVSGITGMHHDAQVNVFLIGPHPATFLSLQSYSLVTKIRTNLFCLSLLVTMRVPWLFPP
jgi:hypothetical protein